MWAYALIAMFLAAFGIGYAEYAPVYTPQVSQETRAGALASNFSTFDHAASRYIQQGYASDAGHVPGDGFIISTATLQAVGLLPSTWTPMLPWSANWNSNETLAVWGDAASLHVPNAAIASRVSKLAGNNVNIGIYENGYVVGPSAGSPGDGPLFLADVPQGALVWADERTQVAEAYTLGPGVPATAPGGVMPNGIVGEFYSWASPTGNAAGLTYSATGLPPGLSINPTTGVVSGTPTAIGTYTVQIDIANSGGNTISQTSYTVTIFAATPITIILTSGTSWTVPVLWNNNLNTVAIIGPGGGGGPGDGAYNYSSGGGGGGSGAWTVLTNLVLVPGSKVSMSFGPPGGANGGQGGSTTFHGVTMPGGAGGGSGGVGGDSEIGGAGGAGGSPNGSAGGSGSNAGQLGGTGQGGAGGSTPYGAGGTHSCCSPGSAGSPPSGYGGGGGGGEFYGGTGAGGGIGAVIITYTP